ncbi:unnamed protein product [Arctogadus glacialis]
MRRYLAPLVAGRAACQSPVRQPWAFPCKALMKALIQVYFPGGRKIFSESTPQNPFCTRWPAAALAFLQHAPIPRRLWAVVLSGTLMEEQMDREWMGWRWLMPILVRVC